MSDKLVRIKNRYDTLQNWISENPVLAAGEIGIDSTNNIIKVGNGQDHWRDLRYINDRNAIIKTGIGTKTDLPYIGSIEFTKDIHTVKVTLLVEGYLPIYQVLTDPRTEQNFMSFHSATDANGELVSSATVDMWYDWNESTDNNKFYMLYNDQDNTNTVYNRSFILIVEPIVD